MIRRTPPKKERRSIMSSVMRTKAKLISAQDWRGGTYFNAVTTFMFFATDSCSLHGAAQWSDEQSSFDESDLDTRLSALYTAYFNRGLQLLTLRLAVHYAACCPSSKVRLTRCLHCVDISARRISVRNYIIRALGHAWRGLCQTSPEAFEDGIRRK